MGSGFLDFATGQVVTEAEVQGYLMNQTVMYFASAAARDAAITAPEEGMHAYLADTDKLTQYSGSAWVDKFVVQTLVDAKGDLIVATADNVVARLAVGSDGTALIADSAEPAGVKWGSVVTDRAIIGNFSENTASITTATQLKRAVGDTGSSEGNEAAIPEVMDRAGSIVGVTIASTTARTTGTLTVEVYKNAVATGLTVVLDGTNTQYHYTVQASGLDTFVAGDRLDVRATNSSFNSAYVLASITVQYS